MSSIRAWSRQRDSDRAGCTCRAPPDAGRILPGQDRKSGPRRARPTASFGTFDTSTVSRGDPVMRSVPGSSPASVPGADASDYDGDGETSCEHHELLALADRYADDGQVRRPDTFQEVKRAVAMPSAPNTGSKVSAVFETYPPEIRKQAMRLRQLVLDTAAALAEVGEVEETLKWGEPSYVTKSGSTIRLGWKASRPDEYKLLFHCGTTLVDTFKELYHDALNFEGNRAIVLHKTADLPIAPLEHCISLALTYHRRKKLPLLGAMPHH